MAITSGVETITPTLAGQWLSTSKMNRRIYNNVIDRYVRAILNDDWMVNGEPIVFDNTHTLVNGHHRLHACVKAGKSFQSLIVRGVEPRAFDTFDSGKPRSAADVFGLQGYEHAIELGGTLMNLWRFDHNAITTQKVSGSVQELEETLRKYPGAVTSVEHCMKARTIISVSMLATVHCLGSLKDQDTADLFVDSLYDGINLGTHSPIRLLRERCMAAKGRGSGKLNRITMFALLIKAYNYFAAGEPLGTLRWSSGETFPTFGQIDKETLATRRSKAKRQLKVA